MPVAETVTIACDESGAEGENLMRARHPVFVHASVHLDTEEAADVMTQLRTITGSARDEVKSGIVLDVRHRADLLRVLEPLAPRVNINLVEKAYYVSSKLVALLTAAAQEARGIDIERTGYGRFYASVLFNLAPVDLGATFWRQLLRRYNDLIRVYARANAVPPSSEKFFSILAEARARSRDPSVQEVLNDLWSARFFAFDYEGARLGELREMDPMFSTLRAVAANWRIRLGDVPFELLVDRYSTLTESLIASIISTAREDLTVTGRLLPAADLQAIRQTDSRTDSRIQVADIIAGVGQHCAALALAGTFDDDLQLATSEMLDFQGMWSDGSPLDVLYDRRPPQYAAAATS
ncbi:DUF3800 domain-containing protein [Curtobacterium sp. MCBA15_012]|uniref:DUF3800 domain-containing protein n=1 Tax=Curtobacterium sp. MCBA15_012 TaxID=1898738 RepID=UPI001113D1F9|nr:DUF3800 domain-containing protein [Curtobacterium sp. MCBA15_012]WIB00325.1 DUF3800 domain-containing protein [Curtobacterium sp. MCBA15_012]